MTSERLDHGAGSLEEEGQAASSSERHSAPNARETSRAAHAPVVAGLEANIARFAPVVPGLQENTVVTGLQTNIEGHAPVVAGLEGFAPLDKLTRLAPSSLDPPFTIPCFTVFVICSWQPLTDLLTTQVFEFIHSVHQACSNLCHVLH